MKSSSLNHVYRIVWNAALGVWQTASEVTTGRGKTKSSKQQRLARRQAAALAALGALGGLGALPGVVFAAGLPTGGVVVGGQATINQAGNALNIVQGTDKAAIDWQSFSVGKGNSVNFQQPSSSSVALNRVLGNDVSVIQGAINANGQVFLVNQSGVLFSPTAQVNVGGIVASTQNISTEDFMAGNYTFSGSSTATVDNQGSIAVAPGGYVALIAAKILNSGNIVADQGLVGLAAGKTVVVDLGGPVKIQVTEGALNTAITQSGGIRADGGAIYLTAKAAGDLASSVINHSGVTRARTLASNQKGEIILLADMAVGTTNVAGTLDASAPESGDGGFIETSAATVKVANGTQITTKSAQGKTGAWLIDPVDFTIAATGGDITGALLGEILSITNLNIQTTSSSAGCVGVPVCGAGKSGNGDIHVNDAVTWSSPAKLTLSAYRNVNINADITATGSSGSLALEIGQGMTDGVIDGVASDYTIAAGKKVSLQAGNNFSLKTGSSGTTDIYQVITQLGTQVDTGLLVSSSLQGLASSLSPNTSVGKYVLGADINAADTSTWNSGAGFVPIGTSSASFTGQFHGLGHTISNLNINRPTISGVGLFGLIGTNAMVRDVGLLNATVKGNGSVGTLVGSQGSGSTVKNAYATGGNVNGDVGVGGLIGSSSGIIRNAHADVAVSGRVQLGGLVGMLDNGSVSNAYAKGNVTASSSSSGAGGLVGRLTNSSISNVYATGTVSAVSQAGGLVGHIDAYTGTATITNAYATGAVKTQSLQYSFGIGGLVGSIGGDQMGGGGTVAISNTYATGEVQGRDGSTGALVGAAQHSLASGAISNSFWDASTVNPSDSSSPLPAVSSGALISGGVSLTLTNVSGKTTAEMKDKVTFANAGWSISGASGEYPTLRMDGGNTIWLSGADTLPIYISLGCGVLCYNTYGDNVTLTFGAFNAASNGTAVTDASLSGTAAYSVFKNNVLVGTSLDSLTDAGTYTVTYTGGLTSGNSLYSLAAGSTVQWVVNPRTLTVELTGTQANPLTKVYDGNATLALTASNFLLSGFVGAQGTGATLLNATTGTFNSKDVTSASTVTATLNGDMLNLTAEGAKASNYVLPTSVSKAATITPKALTVTGSTVTGKQYDGGKTAMVTAGTLSGLVSGESLGTTTGSGLFADQNVGANQDVAVTYTLVDGASYSLPAMAPVCVLGVCSGGTSAVNVVGAKASNYTLAGQTLKGSITKRDITVGSIAASGKTYDGTTTATISKSGVLGNLVQGEELNLTTTGSFTDQNAGVRTVSTSTSITDGTGGLASNYNLTNATNQVSATISQKALTVAGIAASGKIYDGKTDATISNAGTVATGIAGEVLTVSTTGSFDSKNAGDRVVNTTSVLGDGAGGLASNYSLTNTTNEVSASISQKALTVSGITASDKTYDGTLGATTNVSGAVLSGLVADDNLVVSATGTFADKNAATGKTVSLTSSYTGDDVGNYDITSQASTTASITPREITGVTGVTATNKVYDGKTTASVALGKAKFTNMVSGDDLQLLTTGGAFANANAGVGKTVTLKDVELDGVDARNYVLNVPVTTTATIDQRAVTASGISAWDKEYDGTTTALLSGAGQLSGVLTGDVLGVVASGAFDDKNAGVNKHVDVSLSLSGASAQNYKLSSDTLSATASITPRAITGVAGVTAKDKVYDGTTTAKFSMAQPVFNRLVAGDDLSLVTSGATFANANAGTNKTVTLQDVALTGADAGNYVLTVPVTAKATIDQRALTVTGVTVKDKVYDGKTTAVLDNSARELVGLVGGESVNISSSGVFSDKNVGTDKDVDVTFRLTGTAAQNYRLSSSTLNTTASITQRKITGVSGVVAADKVYDGTRVADLDLSGARFNTLVSGDDLSLSSAVGTFVSNGSAGVNKAVTVSDLVLGGADAGNYSVQGLAPRVYATIDQRALTVTGLVGQDKVYDGKTAAVLDSSGQDVVGVLLGETVGVKAQGTFADKNVGTDKSVALSYQLTGTTSKNYKLSSASQTETTGDITQRKITSVTGVVAADKVYDGTRVADLDLSGARFNTLVSGDDLSLSSAVGTFVSNGSAAVNKAVTVSGLVLGGADAGNYSVQGLAPRVYATIDRRALTLAGIVGKDKEYDGTTSAVLDSKELTITGLVAGEKVGTVATGQYDDKNAGTNKHVGVSVALTGAGSSNYKLSPTSQASTTASITPKSLTDVKGIQVADKEYDGTTVAYFYFNQPVLSQVVAGDDVKLLSTGASFSDAEIGAGKLVTVNGVRLAGVDAKNYRVTAPVTTTASIVATE